MNRLTLDTADEAMAELRDYKPGDTCTLEVTFTVASNDNGKLVGDVTDVELGDESAAEDPEPEGTMGKSQMGGHKPVAVLAISMKK